MTFIDQTKIFYGSSAFLGILAIFYFGFEYLVALSPFTISTILFALFLGFLGLGLRKEENTAVLSYIFSAGAYIIGLFYTTGKFEFSSDPFLLSLIVSSGLFAGLGYLITQKEFELTSDQFKYGLIILTIIIGGLVVYDVGSSGVDHRYYIQDSVEMAEEVTIGEVTTEKSSLLPREREGYSPGMSFQACVTGNSTERISSNFYTETDTMVFGSVDAREDIVLDFRGRDVEGLGTIPIEVVEDQRFGCREDSDERVLRVSVEEGKRVESSEMLD